MLVVVKSVEPYHIIIVVIIIVLLLSLMFYLIYRISPVAIVSEARKMPKLEKSNGSKAAIHDDWWSWLIYFIFAAVRSIINPKVLYFLFFYDFFRTSLVTKVVYTCYTHNVQICFSCFKQHQQLIFCFICFFIQLRELPNI